MLDQKPRTTILFTMKKNDGICKNTSSIRPRGIKFRKRISLSILEPIVIEQIKKRKWQDLGSQYWSANEIVESIK